MGILAMFGALFGMLQYFQAVLGADPQGSGLRLLPVIAGLVSGALPADRVAAWVGAKMTVAFGFALLAAGMIIGSHTSLDSSTGFVAAWMAVVGAGMGLSVISGRPSMLSNAAKAVSRTTTWPRTAERSSRSTARTGSRGRLCT
jgi:DHA2 family multidrug resistance protein-like MFS transporter